MCESGGDFLSLIDINGIIEGVIILKGIPEGFGFCQVSIEGIRY